MNKFAQRITRNTKKGDYSMPKILIIEDEAIIRTELKTLLERNGYVTIAPDNFGNIVSWALDAEPQLILLDLGLPNNDGHQICRELREKSSVPIIIVTSHDTDTDELMSMMLGADDFITKPYNTHILLARIEHILYRAYGNQQDNILRCGDLLLDQNAGTVKYNKSSRELTKNELRILRLLMKNQGKIISRDQLMNKLWQTDEFVDDNTLTVNINRLRKKLREIGSPNLIQTKRGQGYKI